MKHSQTFRTLLRIRTIAEEAAMSALRRAVVDSTVARAELQSAIARKQASSQNVKQFLTSASLSGAELAAISAAETELDEWTQAARGRYEEAEDRLRFARTAYSEARKQRQVVEALRDHARSQELAEELRREQAQIDEVFLITHAAGQARLDNRIGEL